MLTICETVESVREQVREWRQRNQNVVFVPTMGNLHEGHLRLVDEARQHGDRVVVSIFVNPSQFAEGEDFTRYPRTRDRDIELLTERVADMVFIPEISQMYTVPNLTVVEVNDLSGQLCGAFRPGHFGGVATVVCKLFNIVQPDTAIFGEKDYQQLILIKTMVSDLMMSVKIIGVPTVRSDDGLALSSRNQYLTDNQRKSAHKLYEVLKETRDLLKDTNNIEYAQLEQQQYNSLKQHGFKPDYFAIRDSETLQPPAADNRQQQLVILVAAWLGQTRLIDNLKV
ncbi:MAG: pantoate--beta-alanine ligase [Gammaproteobacteria bacterium]|nr:pantoate--beta-alanine ligase [Gammaproteobacteria bacterium]